MSLTIVIVLLTLALVGHGACWLALHNRLEGLGWDRRIEKSVVPLIGAGMLAVMCWIMTVVARVVGAQDVSILTWPAKAYLLGFSAITAGPLLVWAITRLREQPTALVRANHTVVHDLRQELGVEVAGDPFSRLLLRIPQNECLSISIHEKTLQLPGLDPALAGLSIAHLSDMHLSGKIGLPWFERAIDLINDMDTDLVAVTGDLVEKTSLVPWAAQTLGRLRARHGVYFVLGNHDLRSDVAHLRETLRRSGLIDLGGAALPVDIRGRRVLLVGNERPWFKRLPQLPADAAGNGGAPSCALSILLSHTPDQIGWARRQRFQLMLAGHTHGGQIRLPGLGAIVAPSLYGGKYAGGVFYAPPTLMHVSRGLSGLHLLRWNCPPELAKLVLVGE